MSMPARSMSRIATIVASSCACSRSGSAMPYEWRFGGNILRSSASGVFTTAEALQFLQEAAAAERARGVTAHRLSDLRQVTDFAIDYNAMRKIAEQRAATRTKTAMLTRN